jgi:hypothetical protein
MKDDFASARGYHADMPIAINASGFASGFPLDELRADTTYDGLRVALGDDATVVASLEAMLARSLIFRTVVPTLRFFVVREFEEDDFLKRGTFQDFMTPMNGEKSGRVLLKTGRN